MSSSFRTNRVSYPNTVSITRIAGLSLEAQAVEARTIEQVSKGLDALVGQYRQRFGVVVVTDLARELFGEYAASLQSRLDFALAVQRSASHVADEVFGRILAAPVLRLMLFSRLAARGLVRQRQSGPVRGHEEFDL
jgi:hypothetical protein